MAGWSSQCFVVVVYALSVSVTGDAGANKWDSKLSEDTLASKFLWNSFCVRETCHDEHIFGSGYSQGYGSVIPISGSSPSRTRRFRFNSSASEPGLNKGTGLPPRSFNVSIVSWSGPPELKVSVSIRKSSICCAIRPEMADDLMLCGRWVSPNVSTKASGVWVPDTTATEKASILSSRCMLNRTNRKAI